MKNKCINCPYNQDKLGNGCGNDYCIQENRMFENCSFNMNLDTKDLDVKNITNFKETFKNIDKLPDIKSLEQIIEELWDKEPTIKKMSAVEVIEKCKEKGWELNLYNIIKIREDCKKDKMTYK